jgi:hypothetical protein
MRMISVERNVTVPADNTWLTIKPVGSVETCGPNYGAVDVAHPHLGYTPRYERYTPNSFGSRKTWKSFAHFRSDQATTKSHNKVTLLSHAIGAFPNCHGYGETDYIGAGYDSYYVANLLQPFGDMGSLDSGLVSFMYDGPGGEFIPPPVDLDGLWKNALASTLPLIKAELSLPNFLLELKDFKRPLMKAASVFKSPSWYSALQKMGLAGKTSWSIKRLLQGAAGNYLNLQFNILPFLSDIAKIRSAMSRTEKRINDFVVREGRPQNRHYAFKWSEFPDSYEEQEIGRGAALEVYHSLNTCYSERRVVYDPSVFHVQIQYNYSYTGYQIEHARLLGHLDALGINLNPAIVWNAIPWTFVIDWVLGVGPYLDSLKSENMRPQINIRQALWSILRKRRIVVEKTILGVGGTVHWKGQMPAVEQTAYRRSVGLPSVSSITSSGLTLKEVSLGAALVIVRGRKRK